MKKILSIILGAIICTQAFAQVSVNAGYLNAFRHGGENGTTWGLYGDGFYAGASVDIKSSNYPQFAFEPGVNFNLSDYNRGTTYGFEYIEYFITAPLHLKYTQPVSNVLDIFVSAGPTLLCTLGGKSKASYGGFTYFENEKGGDFDVTFGLQGGVKLSNNIKFMTGYDFGLVNQSGDEHYRTTRNFFHIGIGYIF